MRSFLLKRTTVFRVLAYILVQGLLSLNLQCVGAQGISAYPNPEEKSTLSPQLTLDDALLKSVFFIDQAALAEEKIAKDKKSQAEFISAKRNLLKQSSKATEAIFRKLQAPSADIDKTRRSIIWFLTNYEFIKDQLLKSSFQCQMIAKRKLPYQGQRVYSLVRDFVNDLGYAPFKLKDLFDFLCLKPQTEELNIAELDSIPSMINLVILENFLQRTDLVSLKQMKVEAADELFIHTLDNLKFVNKTDFSALIAAISVIDKVLQQEEFYLDMDTATKIKYRESIYEFAKKSGLSETQVAKIALNMAEEAKQALEDSFDTEHADKRLAHVGYYLIDEGKEALEKKLEIKPSVWDKIKRTVYKHRAMIYLRAIFTLTTGSVLVLSAYLFSLGVHPILVSLLGGMSFSVFNDVTIILINKIAAKFIKVDPLPRMNFWKGIPDDCRTLIGFHAIYSSEKQIDEIITRMERTYLNNKDKNIFVAVLGDPQTATKPGVSEKEKELIKYASIRVKELNKRYEKAIGLQPFFLIHRGSVWNERLKQYIGWERKRGKLEELNLWLRDQNTETTFNKIVGKKSSLIGVKYVLTLDEDTELPEGMARKFIEAMAHPLNRAVIDPETNIVTKGFGMIYPCVGLIPSFNEQKSVKTLYRQLQLWERDHRDMEVYKYAFPDLHQYIFGEGTFTGKGIYDVDVMNKVLHDRFPLDRLLSHDQIEGFYVRAGLATDMVLLEGTVEDILNDYKRKELWARGDWQDINWMFGKVADAKGEKLFSTQNVIQRYNRWKIFDKIRRTLNDSMLLGLLVIGWFVPQIPLVAWTAGIGVLSIANRIPLTLNPRVWLSSLDKIVGLALLDISLLAYSAYENICVLKTVFKNKLIVRPTLDCVLAADLSQFKDVKSMRGIMRWARMSLLLMLGVSIALAIYNPGVIFVAMPFFISWILAPFIIYRMSQAEIPSWIYMHGKFWKLAWLFNPDWANKKLRNKVNAGNYLPNSQEKDYLRQIAKGTWQWFDAYVTKEENWLPPDNTMEEAGDKVRIGHYTSPTNIGLYMVSVVSAWDLNFIDKDEAVQRIRNTFTTLKKLEKWNGHLFNYYDTKTLTPRPRYVSVVDSGNFAASLLVIAKAFPKEKDISDLAMEMFNNMNFAPLFDPGKGLFYTGYDQEESSMSNKYDESGPHVTILEEELAKKFKVSYYDMLVSEARIASFIAIAKGDAPAIHWFNLRRPVQKSDSGHILLSWGGTSFEFLMPQLFMKEKELSPYWLGMNNMRAVKQQISYAKKQGLPVWGISESAYSKRTDDGGYHYQAFGTPGLGLRYYVTDEKAQNIISSYGSIIGIDYAAASVLKNLYMLESLGARGKYGFYESIDGDTKEIVKTYMVHHQGMSLIALTNYLKDSSIRQRFHEHPLIKNVESLLVEDAPAKEIINSEMLEKEQVLGVDDLNSFVPAANLLSNGNYSVFVNNRGEGASKIGGELTNDQNVFLTRWSEGFLNHSGKYFYLKDNNSGNLWSLGYEPTRPNFENYEVTNNFYSTKIMNRLGGIKSESRVFVPLDADLEVWEIKLTNESSQANRSISLVSYLEWVLNKIQVDQDHNSYNKLFVNTEYDPDLKAIFARHRETGLIGFHAVNIIPFAYETSRRNFIGRNKDLGSPQALSSGLSNTQGITTDAIGSLGVSVDLAPGESKKIVFLIGAAKDKSTAAKAIKKYTNLSKIQDSLLKNYSLSDKRLFDAGFGAQEREYISFITSRVICTDPELLGSAVSRDKNELNQPGLWKHGISGDFPMILAKISSQAQIEDVMTLIKTQTLLGKNLLKTELVILNQAEPVQEKELINDILNKFSGNGIFLMDAASLEQEDIDLLESWARLIVERALAQLIKAANNISSQTPDFSIQKKTELRPAKVLPAGKAKPAAPYGEFQKDGSEFVINTAHTPRPWSHILSNPEYGTLVTNSGAGYSWYKNAQQNRITPYLPDMVTDEARKAFYLKDIDSGELFSPTFNPMKQQDIDNVRYGMGYAVFTKQHDLVDSELTVFVPQTEPVEVWLLKVKNKTSQSRNLRVGNYFELVLGDLPFKTRYRVSARYDPQCQGLFFQNKMGKVKNVVAFSATSMDSAEFETDRRKFIGLNQDLSNPQAMQSGVLSNATGINIESMAGFSGDILLEPGQEKTVVFILGATDNTEDAPRIVRKYRIVENAERALQETKDYWHNLLSTTQVHTDDKDFNSMVNYWLKYQTIAGHMYARTGYYQSGGAFGFRDQLQSSLIGLYVDPLITRKQLILHSAHQFEEGDVQHWWHPEDNLGVRSRMSDNLLWLGYVLYKYVRATGDQSILDVQVPYLKGRPLPEGAEGDVYIPEISDKTDTVYAHVMKAIDLVLTKMGPQGLPLIGSGDWNDGLSNLGMKGKGESVWLAFFLYDVMTNMAEIIEQQEGPQRKEYYLEKAEQLKQAIEENAWDGNWYKRAFNDQGKAIGTVEGSEWKIDLIPQAWSVMSGFGNEQRSRKALAAVEEHLVKENQVLLAAPPFETGQELNPGKIMRYPSGIRENGGQYTHGSSWLVMAFGLIGEKKKAYDIFKKLMPTSQQQNIETYQAEPYVVAADIYYGREHTGRAGWTWYTGSSAWLFLEAMEGVLGLSLKDNKLILPFPKENSFINLLNVSRSLNKEGPNKIDAKITSQRALIELNNNSIPGLRLKSLSEKPELAIAIRSAI
ncbi:MAG: glucoamylase family protein [Candidatus Omnitrophota bacterium]